MGITIKDAELVRQVKGTEKFPVSDGSGNAKAVTTEQIKDYVVKNIEVNHVQSDWNEKDEKSDAYIKNKPSIPSLVTEQTVTEWGFTKNKGDYSKPQGGIPKSDLNSSVQDSLNKANSALQEHQSLRGYATDTYVANAIKQAITTTLNTEV